MCAFHFCTDPDFASLVVVRCHGNLERATAQCHVRRERTTGSVAGRVSGLGFQDLFLPLGLARVPHFQVESEWSVLWLPLSIETSPVFALLELRAQHKLEHYSSIPFVIP